MKIRQACSVALTCGKLRAALPAHLTKIIMQNLKSLAVLLALGCYAPLVLAETASVSILSPRDGVKLDPKVRCRVYYEFSAGPKGDHAHLYMDDKQVAELRRTKDSYTLNSLTLGEHEICIKVVNKGHKPIGTQQCNKITVEQQEIKFEESPKLIHGH